MVNRTKKTVKKEKKVKPPLMIDIGCGKNKQPGYVGLDQYEMEGVDHVCDLTKRWPLKDNSVDKAYCSHFIEHLTNFENRFERVHFFNELYRVMKVGAEATIILPHWCSNRYYGDPTHKEPFSEMGFYYLDQDWRKTQAPHSDIEFNENGYSCNFLARWGYSLREDLLSRNTEYQLLALQKEKEAAQDIMATLIKK